MAAGWRAMTYPVWTDDSKRLLRDLAVLWLFRSRRKATIAGLKSLIDDTPAMRGVEVSHQNLRRFLFQQTQSPHKPALLNGLYSVLVRWLRSKNVQREVRKCAPVMLAIEWGWLKANPPEQGRVPDVPPTMQRAEGIAAMFSSVCGLNRSHYESAAQKIAGRASCRNASPELADKAGFLTYRYGTTPGNVVRSFTAVTPPSVDFPFCWFENVYRQSSTAYSRIASGVAVELGGSIYLMGVFDQQDGLKVMVFPKVNSHAHIISGLIATSSGEGAPLVGRVVLQRVAAKDVADLSKDVRPDAIEFDQPSTDLSNVELRRRLRNLIGSKTGKGEAGVSHLPFNQALVTYAALEARSDKSLQLVAREAKRPSRQR